MSNVVTARFVVVDLLQGAVELDARGDGQDGVCGADRADTKRGSALDGPVVECCPDACSSLSGKKQMYKRGVLSVLPTAFSSSNGPPYAESALKSVKRPLPILPAQGRCRGSRAFCHVWAPVGCTGTTRQAGQALCPATPALSQSRCGSMGCLH